MKHSPSSCLDWNLIWWSYLATTFTTSQHQRNMWNWYIWQSIRLTTSLHSSIHMCTVWSNSSGWKFLSVAGTIQELGAQVKLLFWYYYCDALITMPTESSTWVQEGTLIPERPKTYQVVKPIWQSSLLHTEITFLSRWYWQSSQRSPQLYLLWSLLKSELNASRICACKQPNQWAEKTTQSKPHRSISFL